MQSDCMYYMHIPAKIPAAIQELMGSQIPFTEPGPDLRMCRKEVADAHMDFCLRHSLQEHLLLDIHL